MHKELPFDDYEPVLRPRGKGVLDPEDQWTGIKGNNQQQSQSRHPNGISSSPAPDPKPAQKRSNVKRLQENWIVRKGHLLSYIGLFIFSVVLYFRPYELFEALSSLNSMAFWLALATLVVFFPTQFALEGNLTERPREINLVLFLLAAGLLSIPFAIDRELAWESFTGNFLKACLMFIVMVNVIRTRARWKGMVFLNLAACAVVSIWALTDFFSGKGTVEGYRVEGRLDGLFKNPNEIALNLVIVIPIALGLLLGSRTITGKLALAALTLLMVLCIFVTYSRGGFLGLATATTVFIWKLRRKHRTLSLVFALAAVLLLIVVVPGGYMNRMISIVDHSRDVAGSAESRWELLLLSLKVAARHPLLGIGMRNFEIVSIHGLVTHNAYTQVATEMGIPAMIAFILFLVTPFKRLTAIEHYAGSSKEQKWFYYVSVGLQASLIGFMVCIFFGAVAYQWYTYYLVGYAVTLRRVYMSSFPVPDGVDSKTPVISPPTHRNHLPAM